MALKSKRSKACDISERVKTRVWERDGGRCIICKSPYAAPNSHFIKRSAGGLGIEENVTTMCGRCHEAFEGPARKRLMPVVEAYLKSKYHDWDAKNLIYKRW